jgi:shikimate dehydrogenase
MKKFGLIGKKLTHSFSPKYFHEKFQNLKIDARYDTYELEKISEFQELIKINPNICGLNVTIPYKKEIIQYLDDLDKEAAQIGAVNTIQFIRNGQKLLLKGYNTDIAGFEQSLRQLIGERQNLQAIILGTGGAAASVNFVLKKLQIPFLSVSRKPKKDIETNYKQLNQEILQQYQLIINTTPIGMFPNLKEAPLIPYQFLGKEHLLFDLIYNPTETEFLKKGKIQGAKTKNGMEMLEIQAEEAWKIWNMA